MNKIALLVLSAALLTGVATVVCAQNQPGPSMADVSANDPTGPVPDPSHIPIVPPEKMANWIGSPKGEQHIPLFGDPAKPGMYGMLIKWNPGTSSRPHFHDQDRFIYVVSGTWWVSSSAHFDPKLTYPLPAGTFAEDVANTVHWDGARAGGPPVILELVGMGPVKTIRVDENGKPLPRPDKQ